MIKNIDCVEHSFDEQNGKIVVRADDGFVGMYDANMHSDALIRKIENDRYEFFRSELEKHCLSIMETPIGEYYDSMGELEN